MPPKDEVLLYKNALSKDSLYGRINAAYSFKHGAHCICTDIESAMQLFPKEVFAVTIKKGEDYDFMSLPKTLLSFGYSKEYEVTGKGSFAVRGDILDIYPVNSDHPYRIDFFGDTAEGIRPYDEATKERLPAEDEVLIIAASDAIISQADKERIEEELENGALTAESASAYARMKNIAEDIGENYGVTAADYLMPFYPAPSIFFRL